MYFSFPCFSLSLLRESTQKSPVCGHTVKLRKGVDIICRRGSSIYTCTRCRVRTQAVNNDDAFLLSVAFLIRFFSFSFASLMSIR